MKKMILLVGMGFLLFSCSSDGTNSSDKSAQNTSKKGKDLNCKTLEKFKDDYGGLLTKEEMASVYPIDFENAKEEIRPGNYGQHIFNWPSDRPKLTIEVVGKKVNVTDNNSIGIKNFRYTESDIDLKSLTETFNMAYKELSEEELERINKNLAKQNEEIKSTGEKMMKVRAKSSWEFIDGLGTSAWYKWNKNYGGELAVMAGRAKFYIIIKISDDPIENRDLARKLAEKVISKC